MSGRKDLHQNLFIKMKELEKISAALVTLQQTISFILYASEIFKEHIFI